MAELSVPQVDFSSLGQLPQVYNDARTKAVRERTLAELGNGTGPLNYEEASRKLLAAGDREGAMSLATLGQTIEQRQYQRGRDTTQDQFRREEAQRAQNNSDRGFGLQQSQFNELKRTHDLELNKPFKIGSDLGGDIYAVRSPDGSLRRVGLNMQSNGSPSQQSTPWPNGEQSAPSPQQIPQGILGAGMPSGGGPSSLPQPQVQPQDSLASNQDLSAIDQATGRRESYLKSLPTNVREYIKKVADYEIDPRTSSIRGGHRENIMSAVAQYSPGYDQNTFPARGAAVKAFSTGPQGNAVRSFDVAIDHLETVDKLATALGNGDTQAINNLKNIVKEKLGYDAPVNFNAAKSIVGAEIAKAIVGGQNALQDRQELREALTTASSPQQLRGVISSYTALMAGQIKGLKKQYEETTGRKDFDNRLRDATRTRLLGGEGGAPPTGGVVDYRTYFGGK